MTSLKCLTHLVLSPNSSSLKCLTLVALVMVKAIVVSLYIQDEHCSKWLHTWRLCHIINWLGQSDVVDIFRDIQFCCFNRHVLSTVQQIYGLRPPCNYFSDHKGA